MTTQVQEISRMIRDLGSTDFENSLFAFFSHGVPIAQCTLFQFPKQGRPKTIMAVGQNASYDRSAKRLAQDYTNGLAYIDPHLPDYQRPKDQPQWQIYVPENTPNDLFQTRFYDQPRLACDLTMTIPYSDGVMVASIYRSQSQGLFQPDEVDWMSEMSGLCASLIDRHVGALHVDFTDSLGKRSERYNRVLRILREHKLSAREAEICTLILMGHTTCGIALELDISENTVGTHRKRAYAKLGIATQNELFCHCFDAVISQH